MEDYQIGYVSGWKITTAFTMVCTSIVERCVVDAKANADSMRRVLWVMHGGEVFSTFVGLAIRGGHTGGGYEVSRHSTQYSSTNNTKTPSAGRKQRRELK